MQDILSRMSENLVGRLSGPMRFRLVMQPLMAVLFAIRDGRKDARQRRPAYFWALFTHAGQRRDLLRSCWKSVGKIFILALILDAIYQFLELHWFYPGEAVIMALVLAIVPYVMLRGPVNRLIRRQRTA
jgi:hypothetical protein